MVNALAPICFVLFLANPSDWPQILGPHRDGVAVNEKSPQPWPSSGPKRLWQREIGSGFAGPVISRGKCYLFHRVDSEDLIECFDALSGKTEWKRGSPTSYVDSFGFDNGPRCVPVVSGEEVFTLSAQGLLTCREINSGQQRWAQNLADKYGAGLGYFGIATSPLVTDFLVIVNIGGKQQGAGIVALDRKLGKEIWKTSNHEASYSAPILKTVAGRPTACFFTREGVVGLNPDTGAEYFGFHWRARGNASVNAATPLVVGDELFVSASYQTGARLVRIKPAGFDVVWENDSSLSCHYNTSIVSHGFLFGIDGRQEEHARLRCVEWKTGTVQWSQERFGCAGLILVQDRILALTENGELVLFDADPKKYNERCRTPLFTANEVRALPAIADGKLYARDKSKLICVDLQASAK
jgi:outer membrane protein assembly factor BamB